MQEESKLEKKTQAELGHNLPVGVAGSDGQRKKDFTLRPWRLKEEKELGKLRAQSEDTQLTHYVGMILGTMCARLGGVDVEALGDLTRRRLFISQMFVADVFYAYLSLRIEAIGPEMQLKLKCPKCNHSFDFAADLSTTEVWTLEGGDGTWSYTFKDPIQLRGKTVPGLRLGPARWASMEDADIARGDTGMAKTVAILGTVRGFIGSDEDIVLTPNELDEMTKRDIEALLDDINNKGLGPVMSVEATCAKERCARAFRAPIDWGYDSFFSTSSR